MLRTHRSRHPQLCTPGIDCWADFNPDLKKVYSHGALGRSYSQQRCPSAMLRHCDQGSGARPRCCLDAMHCRGPPPMHQLKLVAASVVQCFDARSAGPALNRQILYSDMSSTRATWRRYLLPRCLAWCAPSNCQRFCSNIFLQIVGDHRSPGASGRLKVSLTVVLGRILGLIEPIRPRNP